MARRSTKLLRFENTLYKYDNKTQLWIIDNVKTNSDRDDLFDSGTHATCKHMSQKVVPTKLRRGVLDSWSLTSFVNYKSEQENTVFQIELFIRKYIQNIFSNLKVFLDKIEIKIKNDTIFLNISFFEPRNISKRDLVMSLLDFKKLTHVSSIDINESDFLFDKKNKNTFLNPFFLLNSNSNLNRVSYRLNMSKLVQHIEHLLQKRFGLNVFVKLNKLNDVGGSATLFAGFLTKEVEKSNANFKKALRETFQEVKTKSSIKGIRVNCSGRLGRAPMAKTEWFKFGQIPLNTINAPVQYAGSTAFTKYGSIGIKVWIYHHKT